LQQFSQERTELVETMIKFASKNAEITSLASNEGSSFGTDGTSDNFVD